MSVWVIKHFDYLIFAILNFPITLVTAKKKKTFRLLQNSRI